MRLEINRPPKKCPRFLSGFVFGLFFALGVLLALIQSPERVNAENNPVTIAVIGPMSGKDAPSGKAMLDGVRLAAGEVNENGGIQGRQVEVLAFDNRHDKKAARDQALAVVNETDAVAVIGHYYSSLSLIGGEVYKKYCIPAVTGSATAPEVTEDNDWYFRVISNNNLRGKLSALYLKGVLEKENVHIVYEKDAYGRTLRRAFEGAAGDLGLAVKSVRGIDSQDVDKKTKIGKIADRLAENAGDEASLYVALLDQEAAGLVKMLKDREVDIPILGGDSLGLGSFSNEFESIKSGEKKVGDYTDGIYATTYFIRDIANRKAQKFSRKFINAYDRKPDALAATHYDAASIVFQAIKKAARNSKSGVNRIQVRNALHTFNRPEKSFKGVTGHIYFDAKGNAVTPSPFGIYMRDKMVSAPAQLTPILAPEAVLDLQQEVEKGRILFFEGKYYYKTKVVYTGLDLNEITNIDQKDQSFTADMYLWFRHKGDMKYREIEFANAVNPIDLRADPLIQGRVNDMKYRAYRVKTKFLQSFQFHHYPFDAQDLHIQFRHKDLNRQQLIFVADDLGMQRSVDSDLVKRIKKNSGFKGHNEWVLQDILVYSDIGSADSTLGNPRMFSSKADTGISYSRFNLVVDIKRNAKSYVLKNLVPLFFIFFLGYAMTFIFPEPPPFAARLNLGVILLLTTVSLSLMTSNQLPDIGYLMAMDYLYFFVYFWLLIGIAVTIAVRSAFYNGRLLLMKRLEWFVRIFQPLVLFIVLAVVLVVYF